jgi:AraC family transcriptional regulator
MWICPKCRRYASGLMLCGWAGPQGLLGPKTWVLSIYHANLFTIPEVPTPVDCAITVEGEVKPAEGMTVQEIGGGKYAKYTYQGPYNKLDKAWHDVLAEVGKSTAYTTADKPSLEVYLNDPSQVKPEELITEIYLPVEPK